MDLAWTYAAAATSGALAGLLLAVFGGGGSVLAAVPASWRVAALARRTFAVMVIATAAYVAYRALA